MAVRKILLLAGTGVISITSIAAATADPLPSLQGSLYPADVTDPLLLAQVAESDNNQGATPPPLSLENPELSKALGPAGFILNRVGASAEFRQQIRIAIGRHPAYHAQVSALDETRAGRRRARAAYYPQLSTQLRGDYAVARSFASNTDNVVESLRPREQFTAGISASQLVYDGGATSQRIKGARARHSEFENAISTRINDLSLAALSAYHDLMTHQALMALGNQFITRHKKILDGVKERERLGAGSRADVTRAVGRLAVAQARVAEIRESMRLTEIRYEEFFHAPSARLTRPAFDVTAVNSRKKAVAAALRGSPEIAVAAARADASTAEYKVAKSARRPELRLSVDAVKYDLFNGGDDFDVRAGVNINYNIFGGGARAADIAEAGSRARQARFGEDQIRQEIERDAAIAFERREGADARLKLLATATIANDQTRELVFERYRAARGDLIDVLQAENDYFESGVAYLTGLANRDMAVYGLMEHTGDLLRFFSPQDEYADILNEGVDG